MSTARHRATARPAAHPRRTARLTRLGLVAALVTGAVISLGVVRGATPDLPTSPTAAAGNLSNHDLAKMRAARETRLSRSTSRPVTLEPRAVDSEFATAPLNVWAGPREQGRRFAVLDPGTKLEVTGQREGHWAEVLFRGDQVRWVNAAYLAEKKPAPPSGSSGGASGTTGSTSGGISTAPCPDGSGTESGLVPNAVLMFRAVCNAFPQLSTYGGYDPHGEHADGHAVDFMVSDSGTGQAVADWVCANASALHVYDVIWSQHIWTPERAAEGWRLMPDRGSATANHYDHVHVAVY